MSTYGAPEAVRIGGSRFLGPPDARRARVAVTAVFFVHGLLFASWVAHIPHVKEQVRLSNGALGFALLGAPVGSVLAEAFDLAPTGVDLSDLLQLRTHSTSLFGQAEYDLAPQWTVIVGARGIHEQQAYDFQSIAAQFYSPYAVSSGPALFTLQPAFDDRRTEELWAGKTQLEYRPEKDVLLYVGANRGVKAGSFNALVGRFAAAEKGYHTDLARASAADAVPCAIRCGCSPRSRSRA